MPSYGPFVVSANVDDDAFLNQRRSSSPTVTLWFGGLEKQKVLTISSVKPLATFFWGQLPPIPCPSRFLGADSVLPLCLTNPSDAAVATAQKWWLQRDNWHSKEWKKYWTKAAAATAVAKFLVLILICAPMRGRPFPPTERRQIYPTSGPSYVEALTQPGLKKFPLKFNFSPLTGSS